MCSLPVHQAYTECQLGEKTTNGRDLSSAAVAVKARWPHRKAVLAWGGRKHVVFLCCVLAAPQKQPKGDVCLVFCHGRDNVAEQLGPWCRGLLVTLELRELG